MTNRRRGRHAHTRIILENWTRKPATVGGNVSASSVIRACLSTVAVRICRVLGVGDGRREPLVEIGVFPLVMECALPEHVGCRKGPSARRPSNARTFLARHSPI